MTESAPLIRAAPRVSTRPTQPYLRSIAPCVRSMPSSARSRARASTATPRGFPVNEHGAIVTRPSRRMRFTLPVLRSVQTSSSPPTSAAHTGVGTGVPSVRKVVSSTYVASRMRVRSSVMRSSYVAASAPRGRRIRHSSHPAAPAAPAAAPHAIMGHALRTATRCAAAVGFVARRPGHVRRALLRPRVRLRADAALGVPLREPDAAGCPRGRDHGARALVGLGRDDLGHELARPRQAARCAAP